MRKDISNQLSNRVIRKEEGTSSSTWKCYRCGLIFHEEWVATLHKEISNHSYMIVESSESWFMVTLGSKLKDGTN